MHQRLPMRKSSSISGCDSGEPSAAERTRSSQGRSRLSNARCALNSAIDLKWPILGKDSSAIKQRIDETERSPKSRVSDGFAARTGESVRPQAAMKAPESPP